MKSLLRACALCALILVSGCENTSGERSYANPENNQYYTAVEVNNLSSHALAVLRDDALYVDDISPRESVSISDQLFAGEDIHLKAVLYFTDEIGNTAILAEYHASFGPSHPNWTWNITDSYAEKFP